MVRHAIAAGHGSSRPWLVVAAPAAVLLAATIAGVLQGCGSEAAAEPPAKGSAAPKPAGAPKPPEQAPKVETAGGDAEFVGKKDPIGMLQGAREEAASASKDVGKALAEEADASSKFSKELGAVATEKRDESTQAALLVESTQGRLRAIQIKDQALQDQITEAGKKRERLIKERAEAAEALHQHQQELAKAATSEVAVLKQLKRQRQRVAKMASAVSKFEAGGALQAEEDVVIEK